jgi:ribosome-binding factor A
MAEQKNPHRIEKINSHIQMQMGPILLRFLQGHEGIVTVSRVETSRDMKWAKIWISILGGNDDKILKFLGENMYDIQGELNEHFTTKIIPRISFHLDTSPRYVQHIDELIKEIHDEEKRSKN